MLGKTGIIPETDADKILHGLIELEKLVKAGKFTLDPAKEDVHTNIESWLTDKLGMEVAGKLHTARSRNDQVVTDTKLYLRDQVVTYVANSVGLAQTLLTFADTYKGVPFPGFTHHQHAMVTTFGHILAGFAGMVIRDIERFETWLPIHNQSPLGNAVAYGTSFPIDRKLTAKLLGFDGPDVNSMDAITNRWEAEADLAFAVCVLMNHLSSIAETLILLATPEFAMVKLADQFCTGSSMMPQKKNPHPLEVMKGKAGYAAGMLTGIVSLGKGNFIGYNAELQWTKYLSMDLLSECEFAPTVLSGVISTLTVNTDVMEFWCHKGFIGTTTVMEQLTSEFHLPMRQAKVVVEKAVEASVGEENVTCSALQQALADVGVSLPISEAQIAGWQDPTTIITLTKSFGGPGKKSMKISLKKLKKKLAGHKAWLMKKQKEKIQAQALTEELCKSIL